MCVFLCVCVCVCVSAWCSGLGGRFPKKNCGFDSRRLRCTRLFFLLFLFLPWLSFFDPLFLILPWLSFLSLGGNQQPNVYVCVCGVAIKRKTKKRGLNRAAKGLGTNHVELRVDI